MCEGVWVCECECVGHVGVWLDVRDVRGVKGMCRYVSGVNVRRM